MTDCDIELDCNKAIEVDHFSIQLNEEYKAISCLIESEEKCLLCICFKDKDDINYLWRILFVISKDSALSQCKSYLNILIAGSKEYFLREKFSVDRIKSEIEKVYLHSMMRRKED